MADYRRQIDKLRGVLEKQRQAERAQLQSMRTADLDEIIARSETELMAEGFFDVPDQAEVPNGDDYDSWSDEELDAAIRLRYRQLHALHESA